MEPIKLYVGEHYREPGISTHIELMFPFWGITAKETMPFVRAAALQYQYSGDDFTLVQDIQDADYVVIPYQYERLKSVNPGKVRMIVEEARHAGKTLIIDGAGDIEHLINIPHAVIFRISQYRYMNRSNEITVPYFAEDLLESYAGGQLQLRTKQERPSVAFTGWAGLSLGARVKTNLKELPITLAALLDGKRGAEHKGVFFRERAVRALAESTRIDAHIKTRPSYSGHVQTMAGTPETVRREFVENLLSSDYALCVKGDANNSVRFYEALSLGRIPLFLDTACVLPLEDRINYRDFCVFVDWRDTDSIADILADFHEHVSLEQFEAMQREARDAYVRFLRYDSFSSHLAAALRERLALLP